MNRQWQWIVAHTYPLLGVVIVAGIYLYGVNHIHNTPNPEHSFLERLGWWSQAAATITAILTAFYVAVQVADIKQANRIQAFEAGAIRMQDVARVLLSHHERYTELRKGDGLSVEAELLAETILDNIDTELLRQAVLPDPWQEKLPPLTTWYEDLFREMPGLRQTLDKRKTWYRPELYELKEEAMRNK